MFNNLALRGFLTVLQAPNISSSRPVRVGEEVGTIEFRYVHDQGV